MKQIEITIMPNGQTKIETSGFVGGECKRASAPYRKALGAETDDVSKAEYFQQAETDQQAENRQW